MNSACVYDSHMHTPLCKHARGEPEEYAQVGVDRNLKGIIVTCHSPMPDRFSHSVRMDEAQLPDYFALVERARKIFEGQLDVRLGMESDWFPGMEDWLRDLHGRADLDYILGSIHPFTEEYRDVFFQKDPETLHRQYFDQLAQSAECGLFDSLSHPDLVKNIYPEDWSVDRVLDGIEAALDRIRETGIAMELNTSGVLKSISEVNPGRTMLACMAERNIPVVLGSDSHVPERVSDGFVAALDMLEEAGYDAVSYFLARERHDLPIEQARSSLKAAATN